MAVVIDPAGLTGTRIKALVAVDFPIRMYFEKDRYDKNVQLAIRAWCRDRMGPSAAGQATNRDQPGFYKAEHQRFIDPDIARFLYDPTRLWATRYTAYHFRNPDHAFEFRMRWM